MEKPLFRKQYDRGNPSSCKKHTGRTERAGVDLPKNLGRTLDAAFGYVEGTEACISNIIVGETEIEGAKDLTVVRTGVSRFESAVKKRSLYKEKTAVDGKLKLEIYIRKESIRRMKNGYLVWYCWH